MRRPLLLLAIVGGLVLATSANVAAVASPYSFSDPAGDAPKGVNTDILRVTIVHKSTVRITIKMKHAAPFSRWGTDGNLTNLPVYFKAPAQYYICSAKTSVHMCHGESIVQSCTVARSLDATNNRYLYSFPRSCLNNPASIQLFVVAGAFGSTQLSDSDRAPDAGYSKAVAFG